MIPQPFPKVLVVIDPLDPLLIIGIGKKEEEADQSGEEAHKEEVTQGKAEEVSQGKEKEVSQEKEEVIQEKEGLEIKEVNSNFQEE